MTWKFWCLDGALSCTLSLLPGHNSLRFEGCGSTEPYCGLMESYWYSWGRILNKVELPDCYNDSLEVIREISLWNMVEILRQIQWRSIRLIGWGFLSYYLSWVCSVKWARTWLNPYVFPLAILVAKGVNLCWLLFIWVLCMHESLSALGMLFESGRYDVVTHANSSFLQVFLRGSPCSHQGPWSSPQ